MAVTILVCVDGEPHSKRAIQWAIDLGLSLPAEVTALHVIDPYLKKFYDELYSQGRRQYLEYVDEIMQDVAEAARREFTDMCQTQRFKASFKVRHGDPLEEIVEELQETAPHLLITGRKRPKKLHRFSSGSLPLRLQKQANVSVSILSIIDQ